MSLIQGSTKVVATPKVITGSYTAQASSSSNASSFTFSSLSFGTADATRVLAVTVSTGWNGAIGSISSVTAGGVSLSKQIGAEGISSGIENFRAEIWSGAVPSGTSGSVVVTLSTATGNNRGCAVTVHRLVGDVQTSASSTAFEDNDSGSAVTYNVNVNTKADGYLVGGVGAFQATSFAWTGATERMDLSTINLRHGAASFSTTTDQTPRTVSATQSGGYQGAGVAAAWHPV